MGALRLLALALLVVLVVAGFYFSGGLGGPSVVTQTSTAIQYVSGIKSWRQEMAGYLASNVSVYGLGEAIRIAGFEVVVEDARVLDVLEYNYTRDGRTFVVKQTPFMARWSGGEPEIVGEAVYVYVEVTWRKVSEEEAPGFGEEVGPGPLALLFAPWLILFPASQPLEPSLLDIVVSFDGKWVENRKFNSDPKAPHDQRG